MVSVLILTIVILLVVVGIETACLLLIVRSEYVAISGVAKDSSKRAVKNRPVDHRSFQRPNELLYQSDSIDCGDYF
jgi:hypothetical protein